MSPIVRQGLIAPGVLACATLITWAILGIGTAMAFLAIAAAALIGFHLWHLERVSEWASSPLDTEVPEGRGEWALLLSAIHRRTRLRRAYERDLRHIIERFQQAASALPDGIVLLNAVNRIDWANERAMAQLGLDMRKDRGQPIVNLVRQPEFLRYVDTGDYAQSIVVPSSRDGGRRLALQLVPFAVDQKLLMSRDVTELEATARMRRDFIANVSHELKTPLTVISGFVETLQELDLDERQRSRFLQLMEQQARNMQRLVADLLTLSALESDQNSLHEERFAIVPLLLALSADAKALSKGQHEIELDIAEAATISGNRDELASAFGNLVSNAIRYTPAKGKVTLSWRLDTDGSGVFAVADTGIGVAEADVPRLTERFYRVDRSRSRATGGTGLGLAIVKHVLLRHQADLEISSERGKGSIFAVRLPAQRVERAPAAEDGEPSRKSGDQPTSSEAQRETGA